MNKEVLISVVVPCYNIEKYVEKCVDSILNQTYKKLEIILVNDGSTDQTGKILDKYKDKRIKVIHQKNAGLSAARNSGLEIAKGEYICFIDGDDFIDEKYVEVMVGKAINTNADTIVCGYQNIDESGNIVNETRYEKEKEFSGREAVIEYLNKLEVISIVAWNKLYRTELFKNNKIEYPVGRLFEDSFTTYKLFYYSKKVIYLNESLYSYVQRNGSIMSEKFTANRFRDSIDLVDETKKFIVEKYDDDEMRMLINAFEINVLCFDLYRAVKDRLFCTERDIAINRLKSLRKESRDNKYLSKTSKIILPFAGLLRGRLLFKTFRYVFCLFIRLFYAISAILKTIIPGKKIFILNIPIHGNLGDQAILTAEEKFIRENLKGYRIIEIGNKFCHLFPGFIKMLVGKSPVCMHGGGYLGDLWPNEDETIRGLIKRLDNKILFFPQTLCSENTERYLKEIKPIFEKNKNLSLFGRDEHTYKSLKDNLKNDVYFSPDIVLYNERTNYKKVEKITLCLRNDHEKTMSAKTLSEITSGVKKYKYDFSDTGVDKMIFSYNRKKELGNLLNKIGTSKLLITDRLHGMIFAYLTKTPCLVFNSKSPKVLGVYKWIEKSDYIILHDKNTPIDEEIDSLYDKKYNYNESIDRAEFEEMKKVLLEIVR